MVIKEKTASGYIFEKEDGSTFSLTWNELHDLDVLTSLEQVKSDISAIIDDYDGDAISIGSLDMTREEFEQEVFDLIHDRMMDGYYGDGGNDAPDYDTIQEIVLDTAEDYGIRIG